MEKRARGKSAGPALRVVHDCLDCALHEDGLFCRLSDETLRALNSLRQTGHYPAGSLLFVEGEPPRGLYILCSGRAKLTTAAADGHRITLRVAEPGEIVGLSSVVANKAHLATAETVLPSQVSFIPRESFVNFLHNHADAAARVDEHLSMEVHRGWEQARLLGLAANAPAKVARFLLDWSERHGQPAEGGVRVSLNMTHEGIAEAIGSTRETVSRVLADFQSRRLIRVRGGSVLLIAPDQLQSITGLEP